MVVLALDTATRAGSVALTRGGDLLVARAGDPDRPHATRLPGDLLTALADANLTLDAVDRLAVCLGPGAFTGLRIGIAAMQGLSLATGVPVAGISAFDALAAAAEGQLSAPGLGVWIEAGRGEVFAARYVQGADGRLGPADAPVAAPPAAVLEQWAATAPLPLDWAGDAAPRHAAIIRAHVAAAIGSPIELHHPPLLAEWTARLGRARPAGRPHALRPIYVRRSDAELARDRQLAGPPRA